MGFISLHPGRCEDGCAGTQQHGETGLAAACAGVMCRAASPVTELEEEAPGNAVGCDILAELWLWGLRRRSYFCSGGVCLSSAFC